MSPSLFSVVADARQTIETQVNNLGALPLMTCRTVSIHLLRVAAFLKEGGVKIPCSKPLPASFAASSWRRTRSGITGAPAGAGLANMIFFVKS